MSVAVENISQYAFLSQESGRALSFQEKFAQNIQKIGPLIYYNLSQIFNPEAQSEELKGVRDNLAELVTLQIIRDKLHEIARDHLASTYPQLAGGRYLGVLTTTDSTFGQTVDGGLKDRFGQMLGVDTTYKNCLTKIQTLFQESPEGENITPEVAQHFLNAALSMANYNLEQSFARGKSAGTGPVKREINRVAYKNFGVSGKVNVSDFGKIKDRISAFLFETDRDSLGSVSTEVQKSVQSYARGLAFWSSVLSDVWKNMAEKVSDPLKNTAKKFRLIQAANERVRGTNGDETASYEFAALNNNKNKEKEYVWDHLTDKAKRALVFLEKNKGLPPVVQAEILRRNPYLVKVLRDVPYIFQKRFSSWVTANAIGSAVVSASYDLAKEQVGKWENLKQSVGEFIGPLARTVESIYVDDKPTAKEKFALGLGAAVLLSSIVPPAAPWKGEKAIAGETTNNDLPPSLCALSSDIPLVTNVVGGDLRRIDKGDEVSLHIIQPPTSPLLQSTSAYTIYLPFISKAELPIRIPGERIRSGALDLKRLNGDIVDLQTANLPIAAAGTSSFTNTLRYMVAHTNQAPDVAQVLPSSGVLKPQDVFPLSGWESMNLTYDPQEQAGMVKKDGKWELPPGSWGTWWAQSDHVHNEAMSALYLVQDPKGEGLVFIGIVNLDTGEYFGANWLFPPLGGFSYVSPHLGWLTTDGRVAVTVYNLGNRNLLLHSTYGVHTDDRKIIDSYGEPWEKGYSFYDPKNRTCLFPPGESIHWHCIPRNSVYIFQEGDRPVDANFYFLSPTEFNKYLPPGVRAASLQDDVEAQQAATVVILPTVVALGVAAGIVYYYVTVERADGQKTVLQFPIDLNSWGEPNLPPNPTAVKFATEASMYVLGLVFGSQQLYRDTRYKVFDAYQSWVYERDGGYWEPRMLSYTHEPLPNAWKKVDVATALSNLPWPPQCPGKDLGKYMSFVEEQFVRISDEEGWYYLRLRENGEVTAELIFRYSPEGGGILDRWVETARGYRHADRASFLLMISYLLFAKILQREGKAHLAKYEFKDINNFRYSCHWTWLKALEALGYVLIDGTTVYFYGLTQLSQAVKLEEIKGPNKKQKLLA